MVGKSEARAEGKQMLGTQWNPSLTGFTPEYRLRVGDYRVLFEVEGAKVVVYRVRHRGEAYR